MNLQEILRRTYNAASGAAGTFSDVTCTNVDAGASGTAGTVDVFPSTASKGKLAISCADQTGNTTVSLLADAMAAARTIHIPDPGSAAYVACSTTALLASTVDIAARSPKTYAALWTENGAGTYTMPVSVPAGYSAFVQSVLLVASDAVTSASMVIGDGADADGYVTATNVKGGNPGDATHSLASGGAYAGAWKAYAAAGTISAVITTVGAGTAGRAIVLVTIQPTAYVAAFTKA